MACSVDWHLVLEYTKALAGPAATLTAAVYVARFAIANFRAQKAIERRIDWHSSMHRTLNATADAYAVAAFASKSNDLEAGMKWAVAHAEGKQLAALCAEAWLYASQGGFEAVDRLQEELKNAHVSDLTELSHLAASVASSCVVAASALSSDLRSDLCLPELKLPVHRDPSGELTIRGH